MAVGDKYTSFVLPKDTYPFYEMGFFIYHPFVFASLKFKFKSL